MVRLRNVFLALKDQGPPRRFLRNFFITGNALGLFHIRSHQNAEGKVKVMYGRRKTAEKAAASMKKKHGKYFSTYKCIFCDGYHLGKNRDNEEKSK